VFEIPERPGPRFFVKGHTSACDPRALDCNGERMAEIKVYGADWCSMTTETREHLDELGVDYEYIDVHADPAASKWVKEQNGGKEKIPTLNIAGSVLTQPSDEKLDSALTQAGVSI